MIYSFDQCDFLKNIVVQSICQASGKICRNQQVFENKRITERIGKKLGNASHLSAAKKIRGIYMHRYRVRKNYPVALPFATGHCF